MGWRLDARSLRPRLNGSREMVSPLAPQNLPNKLCAIPRPAEENLEPGIPTHVFMPNAQGVEADLGIQRLDLHTEPDGPPLPSHSAFTSPLASPLPYLPSGYTPSAHFTRTTPVRQTTNRSRSNSLESNFQYDSLYYAGGQNVISEENSEFLLQRRGV
ncbi:hypothetical protein K469DRAFT_397755 [Zopfia rhizophila CBS 207.26]|uniref:Uncharacterized protein n=1 Tax=Zopfia rhizophila CBS 207.26 TaxID=1314779 RepID=A0A6A6DEU2_9PEZI|nr:hypothetical protein K469DRAFT_397755 [Zopfia rhizophila CBS 207.26]